MATCEHSDVGCVVGEDHQTVGGVQRPGEIQVTEDRVRRNEDMHLQRQPRRHVRHRAFQGNGSEDLLGSQKEGKREYRRAARWLVWTRS